MILNIADKIVLQCEIADTDEKMWVGLRGLFSIPGDQGLLFLFGGDIDLVRMTTVGMNFAIDMLFIDSASKVCKIIENVVPGISEIAVADAVAVLEVSAGTCRRYGIREGDGIEKEIY